ncbi:MAG: hypothetical protein Q4F21_06545 [Lachnospiraceae bacterium]|nr:hypothetical protein [Lachnospiraceae bacterium]
MKTLRVMPGVCGLETVLTAESEDGMEVTIKASSKCGAVCKLIESLEQPLDAYEVCFVKPGEGPVYEAACCLSHGACPIPSAVIKCIEAECKLALPADVTMKFE